VIEEKLRQGVDVIFFENRCRCRDGSFRYLEWNSHPKPEEGLIFAIAHDLTALRQAEEALRESEEKYRRIGENISDVVRIMDMDMNIIYASPSVEGLVGEPVAAHMKRPLKERLPPDSLGAVASILTEEFEKDKDPSVDKERMRLVEVEHYRADGRMSSPITGSWTRGSTSYRSLSPSRSWPRRSGMPWTGARGGQQGPDWNVDVLRPMALHPGP